MMLVQTLGSPRIEAGTIRYTPVAAKKFGLLLFLSAQPERRASRTILQAMFFQGLSGANARHSLRELLYKLRQDGIALDSDTHSVTLTQPTVIIDWQRVVASADLNDSDLLSLEAGFLPGYSPSISEDFAEWLDAFRASIVSRLAQAMLLDIERAKHVGNWPRAERSARACLAIDPMNARAVTALAEMLAITGASSRALSLLASYEMEVGPEAQKLSLSIRKLRRTIAEEAADRYTRERTFAFGGREDEMSILSSALLAVRSGAVKVVLLRGEPGIGKSRIISEFAKRIAIEGTTTVRVNVHPRDVSLPLGMVSELVRGLMEKPGALGCSPGSMEWLATLIDPRNTAPRLAADATSYAIGRAVVDLATAVAAEGPLVLIVDDAQWADESSLKLLNSIVSRQSENVLLVLSSRDSHCIVDAEYWGEILCAHEVRPLTKSATSNLLATELASTDCADPSLLEWMVDTSGGNPFFADCLLNHFRSTRERYTVPRELNSILDQRIAGLTHDARDALEAIVVLGRHATVSRLERMVDQSGLPLLRATRELEGLRLIMVDGPVRPSHWLIAESVQRSSSGVSQRILSRRMAAILEGELPSSRDSSELWECAEAWAVAGESRRAADLIATCADRCLALGRAREAALLLIRAAGFADGVRRDQLAENGIRIANSAGESTLVVRGFDLLGRNMAEAHDDIELAVLTARSRLDVDVKRTMSSLAKCVCASKATLAHRLSAATGFLIFCDQNHQIDQVLAITTQILELLEETSPEQEIERLQCGIVYNATFGDLEAVPAACERILKIAAECRADIAADLMRKAAGGFARCGLITRSIEILRRCHKLATDIGLSRLADAAAVMLAGQCRDAGLEDDADTWVALVQQHEFGVHDDYLEFARLLVLSEFEFGRSNTAALRILGDHARRILADRETVGARRLYDALRCAVAHLGNDVNAVVMIDQLTRYHVAGYEIGDLSDFEIAVAASVLRDSDDVDRASELVTQYLKQIRRPGARLSFVLTATALTIGLDASALLRVLY